MEEVSRDRVIVDKEALLELVLTGKELDGSPRVMKAQGKAAFIVMTGAVEWIVNGESQMPKTLAEGESPIVATGVTNPPELVSMLEAVGHLMGALIGDTMVSLSPVEQAEMIGEAGKALQTAFFSGWKDNNKLSPLDMLQIIVGAKRAEQIKNG